MRTVKITTTAGNEVYINTYNVASISKDPMNNDYSIVFFSQSLYYIIKMPLEEAVKLLSS